MGTRADFYVGKGQSAEWIGSIAWDGYRSAIPVRLLEAVSEEAFRYELRQFFASRDDVTLPEQGWPWPWDDSGITDCSYWFFDSRVWDAQGSPEVYLDVTKRVPDFDDFSDEAEARRLYFANKERVEFPDMSSRKAVTFGSRSGLIVVGGA